MPINRIVAQKFINEIPKSVRTAARKERQFVIREQKNDPIAASFIASKGAFPFIHNERLKVLIDGIHNKIAHKGIMGLGEILMPAIEKSEVAYVRSSSFIA